jgi:hypothetical protein
LQPFLQREKKYGNHFNTGIENIATLQNGDRKYGNHVRKDVENTATSSSSG